jgi:hypothetical protein
LEHNLGCVALFLSDLGEPLKGLYGVTPTVQLRLFQCLRYKSVDDELSLRSDYHTFFVLPMELFTDSLDNFREYPEKLVRHDALKHNIQAYRERLDFQQDRLFNSRKPAVVDFLDLHSEQQSMTIHAEFCF